MILMIHDWYFGIIAIITTRIAIMITVPMNGYTTIPWPIVKQLLFYGYSMFSHVLYPLGNIQKTMENGHRNSGFTQL